MPGSSNFDLRVCIIGAGPSGLCSLRHALSSTNDNIRAVIFEQQADIGGVWNYTGPDIKLWDSEGNPMVFPMYSNLRCNLPRQLMEFRDFKQKNYTGQTFATQQELHDYLVEYADHFRLWPYIKVNQYELNSRVVHVKRITEVNASPNLATRDGWIVTVEDTRSFELTAYTFDAIMCCVGVNFYPKYPDILGIDKFQGLILHSKYFKTTDEFRGKQVVLLGLGPSSADLTLKLAPIAENVVVCHRFPGGFSLGLLPPNVRETCCIKCLNDQTITTEENEEIPCNVVILCTGYEPHFPFLDSTNLIPDLGTKSATDIGMKEIETSSNDVIYHLYKKMLVPKNPTFCFINAHGLVSEFLVMEIQAKYFVSLLEGKVSLPPLPIMENRARRESQQLHAARTQGKLTEPLRSDRFALSEVQKYLEDLALDGGFAPDFRHIPLHLAVWQWVIQRIFGKLAIYRGDELKVLTPTVWEYKCAKDIDENANEGSGENVTKTFRLNVEGTVSITENTIN